MGKLKDQLAIVSGASRGIGEAIAERFAAEGARVVIASRKQTAVDEVAARLNERYPGAIVARACHIGDPAAIRLFVDGSVVEVFTEGRPTFSARAYPSTGGIWRLIGGEGTAVWELGVD